MKNDFQVYCWFLEAQPSPLYLLHHMTFRISSGLHKNDRSMWRGCGAFGIILFLEGSKEYDGSDASFFHFQNWEGKKNQFRTLNREGCDSDIHKVRRRLGSCLSVDLKKKSQPLSFLEELLLLQAVQEQFGASFKKRVTHKNSICRVEKLENAHKQKKCVSCRPNHLFPSSFKQKWGDNMQCTLFCNLLLACQQTCILMIILMAS